MAAISAPECTSMHLHQLPARQCLSPCLCAAVTLSRGEGWGSPHMEVMSMAKLVITTNWSVLH
jgi:hypothetical protein